MEYRWSGCIIRFQWNFDISLRKFLENFEVLKNASSAVGAALPESFNFDKPCLFLAGALSNYILPEDHPNIEEQFPKAEFEVISNAGHWLHAENPKAFQEVMHQWLVSEK